MRTYEVVVSMSTMSAREFNQDVSAAKRAAAEGGPLFITDRVADRLQLDEEVEFEPPRLESFPRAADL